MLFGKKHKSDDIVIGSEDQDPVPPYPNDDEVGEASSPSEDQIDSSSSPYPPQSYHDQSPSHTFLIRYTNKLWTDIAITDRMEPHKDLYTAHLKYKAPHMVFSRPSSDQAEPLATVKFHSFHSNLDILLNNTPIDLHIKTLKWKPEATYESPALGGAKLTWKVKTYRKTIDIECRDESGVPLARIFTTKQLNANLDFFGERMFGGGEEKAARLLDELVVAGTALAQYNLMVVMQSWAAAVS